MLALTSWFTISVRALPDAAPLKNGARLLALLGTSQFDVRLRLLDRDVLDPAQSGFAQLHFAQPVAFAAREHVILRRASPPRTVAGGVILDPETVRARRNDTVMLGWLTSLLGSAPDDLITMEVRRAGGSGISVARLSKLSALSPARVAELLQRLPVVVTRSGIVVEGVRLEELCQDIASRLEERSGGLTQEELFAAVPGFAPAIIQEAVQRVITRGLAERQGGQIRIPRPDHDRAREGRESDLASRIAEALRRAGLTPPDSAQLIDSLEAKRALDRLLRSGVVIRTVDRVQRREFLFHHEAVEDAKCRLWPIMKSGASLLVGEIGAALGISRKHSIPLIEHLDRIQFTQRVGDRRVAGRAADATSGTYHRTGSSSEAAAKH